MKIAVLHPDIPTPAGVNHRLFVFEGDMGPLSNSSGHVGLSVASDISRWAGRSPSTLAWDFAALALAVVGADRLVNRALTSADGWTREIELSVSVSDPTRWTALKPEVEALLSFLTGDFWSLTFIEGGYHPAPPKQIVASRPETCVALLSGGLDSLIGAINMETAAVDRPIYVSNRVRGDVAKQEMFASRINAGGRLLSLNADPRAATRQPEISQRPRSLVFIAFAVLAATVLDKYRDGATVDLHTPENGFISLNVPLTTLRRGSLSTRTTHPHFIDMLQRLLIQLGLKVTLRNTYQLKTKGEMMLECADQSLLEALAPYSMSCGRAGRSYRHCGRCLPCLVRRASFVKWKGRLDADRTDYIHPKAVFEVHGRINNDFHQKAFAEYDDVMQALTALNFVERHGSRAWTGAAITETVFGADAVACRDVADRGLGEIGNFLELTGLK